MLLHCALFFLYKLKSQKALFIEKKFNRKDIYVVILFYMYFHPR